MSGTGVRLALAGKPPKVLSSNLPSVAGVDIADHGDPQRILGQHAADIVLQIGDSIFGTLSRVPLACRP